MSKFNLADKYRNRETCWRLFERAQAYHERFRLINNGTILPDGGYPTILTKVPSETTGELDGVWKMTHGLV